MQRNAALTYGLIAVAVLGLLGFMAWAARRGRPRPGDGAHTLRFRHNAVFRLLAYLATFGIPIGLTALVIAIPPRGEEVGYVVAAYALFAALSLPLFWEASRYCILVSPGGLACRSPWRGWRSIAWDDVRDVSFSNLNGWFVFRDRAGEKIRVHLFVSGVNELLKLVELRVPPDRMAAAKPGYDRVGRPFPRLRDDPVLEPRHPRRRDEW
ncbi:MAG TPA: hypothetical protein VKE40_06650 [Gemmataceae bacterium]|nr:hypothetical protein [Gemmataceae bacterium]